MDNREYENDLIFVLDDFAIVAESKSGWMTRPARRGAPHRLFDTLRRLIEEPALQANRFITYLRGNKAVHRLPGRRGQQNVIDSSAIKYYIPLSVTMTELGIVGANLKKLIDAGIVTRRVDELAPSMCIADLERVLTALGTEAERLHYLARRREFESHVLYEADEMDLFSFYLNNGFNIGEAEFSRQYTFNLTMQSQELNPYYVGRAEGVKVEKPRRAMTKWFRSILAHLSSKKPCGWLDACYVLLSTTEEDQRTFEVRVEALRKTIKRRRARHKYNWVALTTGPPERRFFIGCFLYATDDKDERNDVLSQIVDCDDARSSRGVVCIGLRVDRKDYPYSVFVGRPENDLFSPLCEDGS